MSVHEHTWHPMEMKRPLKQIGLYAMKQKCIRCGAERERVLDLSRASPDDWWKP